MSESDVIFLCTMQILQMSLMLLSAGLFDTIVGSNVIPTKEEQANLLTDVQEVFEEIKLLVSLEANSTDEAVVEDVDRIVGRAKETLSLMQELALTKMSCRSNSVCMLEYKPIVEKLNKQSTQELEICTNRGFEDITANSCRLTNATVYATACGQNLLDTLYNCSRKPGLQVIACYRNVIAKDVTPVKKMLLGAVQVHKECHFRTIEIRDEASDCVDDVVQKYRIKLDRVLEQALHCT